MSFSSSTYFTSFGIITSSKLNIETICITFIVFSYLFELIAKHLKTKISTSNLIYDLTLTNKNKKLKINAYMDTGNFINIQGTPVLILDLNTYLELTNTNLIHFLSTKMEQIKLKTVNGNNNLKTDIIDKIEFKHGKTKIILNNQIVAINTTNCFQNTNYKALLSPLFL